ncbi:hypothetical protein CesoFtcFv8_016935 [Champsocephalus esox]|uniref:Uncharacterized protein n=1 Tax=Champsocephalus esox TaxID=159716 RepID=A0AAN8BIN3_9TELE|nr:hypothetical protein CesoFtcFv8_016935 [Champsocephalus esox]
MVVFLKLKLRKNTPELRRTRAQSLALLICVEVCYLLHVGRHQYLIESRFIMKPRLGVVCLFKKSHLLP